jgi:membrane-associated phospholipid phosphatase
MIKNHLEKLNIINANLIYFICILIALIINIFVYFNASLEDTIEILGTFIQIALPAYAIVPILAKKDKEGFKQMLLFLGVVLSITYILKFTIPVKRPYGGSMSFPSGHTAGAFIGSVFLSYRYGKKYMAIAMPLAIFVGFSRVYSRNHWISDVFGSVVICFVVGLFVVKKYHHVVKNH